MQQSSTLSKPKQYLTQENDMATTDQEQMNGAVNQHKRMAMGADVNGQTMPNQKPTKETKPQGGLSQAKTK